MDVSYKPLSFDQGIKHKEELTSLLESLSGTKRVLSDKQISLFLNNNSLIVIGAFKGNRLIGIASVYIAPKAAYTIGFIEDVVVDREFWGQGIATKLLTTIIECAKKEGVSQFNLTSGPSRIAANKLYLKLGFKIKKTNVFRLYL